jgi:hypothetical protein
VLEKEFTVRAVQKKVPVNKYSHVKGKLSKTVERESDKLAMEEIDRMKKQVIEGERIILALTTKRDQLTTKASYNKGTTLNRELDLIT